MEHQIPNDKQLESLIKQEKWLRRLYERTRANVHGFQAHQHAQAKWKLALFKLHLAYALRAGNEERIKQAKFDIEVAQADPFLYR